LPRCALVLATQLLLNYASGLLESGVPMKASC